MQAKEIEALGKAIGRLEGQGDVDEKTRRIVANAVEDAIMRSSTMFGTATNDLLKRFRQLAKMGETTHA